MGLRFDPDPNFETEIIKQAEMRHIVDGLTEAVAARARQLATSRRIRDSIEGDVTLERHGFVGRVVAAFPAPFVEFGTYQQAARPFLRPALEAEVGPLREGTDA